jgi:hypothetical protein
LLDVKPSLVDRWSAERRPARPLRSCPEPRE